MVNDSLATARDALATFLTTLLGEEHPLSVESAGTQKIGDAGAFLEVGLVLAAEAGNTKVAVSVDEGYLAILSQAMLGEALKPGDEGADDLLKELAAQAFGAVRSAMSGSGNKLPELALAPVTSEAAIEMLGAQVSVIRAEYKRNGETLPAVALISQLVPVREEAPPPPTITSQRQPAVNVAPAAFPELGAEALISTGDGAAFGLLAEVELEVTVELGRRRLALADVLRLTTGSVIELEKLVGEPLQVYANSRLIAEGEAVVIDEQFGIRITNLISSARRTKAFI